MLKIGCHLSSAKGYFAMGMDAVKIGANTFQCFTRNPRGGSVKVLNPEDVAAFLELSRKHGLEPFVAHAPYTLNACSADERVREFAFEVMQEDLARLEYLPGNFYNFHPGSHVKQGVETGIQQISGLLNRVLTPELSTKVLLETMSGKGSEIGRSFEELREIIDRVELSEKLGVCLDTCHVYDAGYDIVQDFDGVLEQFDRIIGLDRLCAVHLNDSKNPFQSHKDRHEKIGEGFIGLDAMVRIINHPSLQGIPICLETPNELDGYAREIALLKQHYHKD